MQMFIPEEIEKIQSNRVANGNAHHCLEDFLLGVCE